MKSEIHQKEVRMCANNSNSIYIILKKSACVFALFLFFFNISTQVHARDSVVADPLGVVGDTCRPSGVFHKSVAESNKSVNLSSAFLYSNVIEWSATTNWNGKMTCVYGGVGVGNLMQDHLYYFTGFNGDPVYLEFQNDENESSYWIKLTAEITGDTKHTVSGITGPHSLAYQTQYSVRAELLSAPPQGVSDKTKTTSNGNISVIPAVMSGTGSGSDKPAFSKKTYAYRAWTNMMNDVSVKEWDTGDFLAYEKISIQFEPKKTTCNLNHDMTVNLPRASLSTLKDSGAANGVNFTLPIVCSNGSGVSYSSRNIKAWLSSNDLYADDGTNQILINDSSTAGGVGIAIRSTKGETIRISRDNTLNNASEIFSLSKDEDLEVSLIFHLMPTIKFLIILNCLLVRW